MNFLPTKKQDDWIKGKVESGYYANASEVLRELIRKEMERDREQKLQELRDLIDEGDKGPFLPFDMDKIIRRAEEKFDSKENSQK